MNGIITRVLLGPGYAFVRGDDDGLSYFAHAKSFVPRDSFDKAREGKNVTFTPAEGEKGLRADDVHLL